MTLGLMVGFLSTTAQSKKNLALNKPAKQSSTSYGGKVEYANDGNTNGVLSKHSVSHTKKDYRAFWQVDLKGEYIIEEIRIWNRVDCCTDRLSNFDIWVTQNDMGKNEAVDPFASESGGIGKANRKFYKVGNTLENSGFVIREKTGRFVRVQLNGKNNLHLAEVQVYGRPVPKGKLHVDNLNRDVVYSYTIYRNGTEKELTVTNQMTKTVTAGYNFDKKVNDNHKTYGELGMKSKVETNEILAKASLEIDAKFGAQHDTGTSTSNAANFGRSTTISQSETMTVPEYTDVYVFNKFVLSEAPVRYVLNGVTYSWVNVLDKAFSKERVDLEFENGEIPPGLVSNDNQIISEAMFQTILNKYNEYEYEDDDEDDTGEDEDDGDGN